MADGAPETILRVQGEARIETARQRDLQSVITIAPAARLIVNLREGILHAARAGDDREFAHGVDGDDLTREGVCAIDDADASGQRRPVDDRGLAGKNLIADAAQEKITALAADVPDGRHQLVRQLLLDVEAVLVNLLGDGVLGGVSARLE